jgi:hypothetical protein
MSPETKALLQEKRYYVFFADGSWRTASADEWKVEQLWKLPIVSSGWEGGEFLVKVIEAVEQRVERDSRQAAFPESHPKGTSND